MPAVEKQWPEVIAMMLADVVHRDGATGKFSILGIHSVIVAPGFPWTHPHIDGILGPHRRQRRDLHEDAADRRR